MDKITELSVKLFAYDMLCKDAHKIMIDEKNMLHTMMFAGFKLSNEEYVNSEVKRLTDNYDKLYKLVLDTKEELNNELGILPKEDGCSGFTLNYGG